MFCCYRSSIFHDNIDHVSERVADFFNKYTDPLIINWCQRESVIDNTTTLLLKPNDVNFQIFIDAVTCQSVIPTKITLTAHVLIYEQIFPRNHTPLITFMKFVLGMTYLLDQPENLNLTHLEDVYPFIGITYFVYDKINNSPLLNANPNNKALILRDIRNLWTIFLLRKTNSHTNL